MLHKLEEAVPAHVFAGDFFFNRTMCRLARFAEQPHVEISSGQFIPVSLADVRGLLGFIECDIGRHVTVDSREFHALLSFDRRQSRLLCRTGSNST